MSNPKRHHYLPQFYLKGFCKDDVLCLYNDKNKTAINLKPNNAALIKNFYTIENDDGSPNYEIEKRFSIIESETAPIIKKIINQTPISSEEKGILALFVGLLQHRTPGSLERLYTFMNPMLEFIKNRTITEEIFEKMIKQVELEKNETCDCK